VEIRTWTPSSKEKNDKGNNSTTCVPISALPTTRHLPVHDILLTATEYTKALERRVVRVPTAT
jgi:hypothetical protein